MIFNANVDCGYLARLVAVALLAGIVGCASGGESAGAGAGARAGASANSQPKPKPNVPAWVLATPSEPGVAFYGVGSGSFKTPEQQDRAVREADAQARRHIAETMGQKIEAMFKNYAIGVVTEEDEVSEESLAMGVVDAFKEYCTKEAPIVRRFTTTAPDANGLFYVYSLVAVVCAEIADVIRDAVANSRAPNLERENARQTVAKLRMKLMRAQDEAYPDAKPLLPPIAGEWVVDAAGGE